MFDFLSYVRDSGLEIKLLPPKEGVLIALEMRDNMKKELCIDTVCQLQTQCGKLFVSGVIASRTCYICLPADLGTSGSFGRISYLGVCKLVYNCLFNCCYVAYRAMLALCESFLGTGRSFSRINYFGVS